MFHATFVNISSEHKWCQYWLCSKLVMGGWYCSLGIPKFSHLLMNCLGTSLSVWYTGRVLAVNYNQYSSNEYVCFVSHHFVHVSQKQTNMFQVWWPLLVHQICLIVLSLCFTVICSSSYYISGVSGCVWTPSLCPKRWFYHWAGLGHQAGINKSGRPFQHG